MNWFLNSFRSRQTRPALDHFSKSLARRFRPFVENLEDRTLLSIAFSGSGNSGLATLAGGPGADQFVVQLKPGDATTIEFSDDGGATFVDAALSGITGVHVSGLEGNDTLTINVANGLVGQATPLPISFDGGVGLDRLVLQGTAPGTITETFTLNDGKGNSMLAMMDGSLSSTITLTSVGSILDTMTADTLTINGDANANAFHLHNGPVLNGFKTDTVQIRDMNAVNDNMDVNGGTTENDDAGDAEDMDSSGTLVSLSFANKTHVVINGQDGNDFFLVTVGRAADGLQTLTLDGGAGTNVAAIRHLNKSVTLTVQNVQTQEADADAVFIEEMYEERLDRPAAASEVDIWMNVLDQQGRQAVAVGIEHSLEARTLLVKNLYVHYLGRSAVNGEEQGWVQLMLQGEGQEQILAGILGSTEFYNRAQTLATSGTPDQRFLESLYLVLLNRSASAAEVNGWMSLLPTLGRNGVDLGFLESNEYRMGMITAFYTNFLMRQPDPVGMAAWMASGQSLDQIRQGFEMSDEFFADG
jgi:hypothetical protein